MSGQEPLETRAQPSPPTMDREDHRWRYAGARRDWLILGVMVAVYLTWALIVFFFEPGIR